VLTGAPNINTGQTEEMFHSWQKLCTRTVGCWFHAACW